MRFIRLNRPYKRSTTGKKFVFFSIICGFFVAIFLSVFQPYGLYEWQHENKYLLISGFGLVTTLTLLITYFVQEVWLGRKIETLGQQLFSLFLRTFLIGLANIGYAMIIGRIDFSASRALWFIWITFTVGIFPVIGLLLFDLFKQMALNESERDEEINKTVELISENKKEDILLDIDELLFINSVDNYCEIFCFDGKAKKALIRGALKNILEQIDDPYVVRTHRSYVVNLKNVEDYSGNSQGLELRLKNSDRNIKVSRKYVKPIRSKLDEMNKKEKNFRELKTH